MCQRDSLLIFLIFFLFLVVSHLLKVKVYRINEKRLQLTSFRLKKYTRGYQPREVAPPTPWPNSTTGICQHDFPSRPQRQTGTRSRRLTYGTDRFLCSYHFEQNRCAGIRDFPRSFSVAVASCRSVGSVNQRGQHQRW